MLDIKAIKQDILDGPYPDNIKDQVTALVNRIEELEKENWNLNKEIGKYSNLVSDIAKANKMLAEQTNRLAKKMIGDEE